MSNAAEASAQGAASGDPVSLDRLCLVAMCWDSSTANQEIHFA